MSKKKSKKNKKTWADTHAPVTDAAPPAYPCTRCTTLLNGPQDQDDHNTIYHLFGIGRPQ